MNIKMLMVGIIILMLIIVLVFHGQTNNESSGTFQYVPKESDKMGPMPIPPPGALNNLKKGLPTLGIMGTNYQVLNNVPVFIWHRGCTPTALGMIYGYWDAVSTTHYLSSNQYNSIASTEHYNDYSLPMDDWMCPLVIPDKSTLGGAHSSNSIADFVKTSRSQDFCCYGITIANPHIKVGIEGYALYRNRPMIVNYYSSGTYSALRNEIICGRPFLLCVDADGDGSIDHSVTGIGYNDIDETIAIYTTWNKNIYWITVHSPQSGNAWGICGLLTVDTLGYKLTTNTVGSGTVSVNPNVIKFYNENTIITAQSSLGWHFDHWSGAISGNMNPVTIYMNSDKTVTATFIQDKYTLSISTIGQGTVNKNPNQNTYAYGTTVQLTAVPSSGWDFNSWGVDITGGNNPATIIINSNKAVTAKFVVEGPPSVNEIPGFELFISIGAIGIILILLRKKK